MSNQELQQAAPSRAAEAAGGSPAQDRGQLIRVLQSSLYVGAEAESIGMVLDYCQAARLDPMQKPVHLVPMRVKDKKSGRYDWQDVVMPGIGLYRIQADRSGSLAGVSAPEFGPMVTETLTDKDGHPVSVTFPEWCHITVRKLVAGHLVPFEAREYWLENYASDSYRSTAPNAMWRKRPRGQLAKCAEAQALRKAFPEIGAAPTAEEMEGKSLDSADLVRGEAPQVQGPSASDTTISDEGAAEVRRLLPLTGRTEEQLLAWVFQGVKGRPNGGDSIDTIPVSKEGELLQMLRGFAASKQQAGGEDAAPADEQDGGDNDAGN